MSSTPQRQPKPSLFLSPPSRDASHISLPSVVLPGAQASTIAAPSIPTHRINGNRPQLAGHAGPQSKDGPEATASSSRPVVSALDRTLARQQQQQDLETAAGQRHADHAEALWAEMQNTLEDVQLSASNGPHVFGNDHAKALEDLRTAQIALAQAWAKSEADEAEYLIRSDSNLQQRAQDSKPDATVHQSRETDASPRKASHPGSPPEPDHESIKTDEETEVDRLLAQKRREANDRFFTKVNSSVLDVVAKLEHVASAMRAVEQESRDIWSHSGDSTSSGSIKTTLT